MSDCAGGGRDDQALQPLAVAPAGSGPVKSLVEGERADRELALAKVGPVDAYLAATMDDSRVHMMSDSPGTCSFPR